MDLRDVLGGKQAQHRSGIQTSELSVTAPHHRGNIRMTCVLLARCCSVSIDPMGNDQPYRETGSVCALAYDENNAIRSHAAHRSGTHTGSPRPIRVDSIASVFTFDEMLAQTAAGRGTFEKVNNCLDNTQANNTETNPQPPPHDGAVTSCGFNLHASIRIAPTTTVVASVCSDTAYVGLSPSIVCTCGPMDAMGTRSGSPVVVLVGCES